MFVRRDNTPRFNSTISQRLFDAKLKRIDVGWELLRNYDGTPAQFGFWERRYLEEIEFLIFNVTESRQPIQALLDHWCQTCRPSLRHQLTLRIYCRVALACRNHAYLLLRIARRLTLKILPLRFMPPADDRYFESESMSMEDFEQLKRDLHSGRVELPAKAVSR